MSILAEFVAMVSGSVGSGLKQTLAYPLATSLPKMLVLSVVFLLGMVPAFAGEIAGDPPSATHYLGYGHYGNSIEADAIEVEVGKPFVISESDTEMQWYPALLQISPGKLLVTFSCSPDSVNPEVPRYAYVWTEDGGQTWSAPVYQRFSGSPWVCRNDGTCLWLHYTLDYDSESIASFPVGRSTDGIHYDWSTRGTVDIAPHKFKPKLNQAEGLASLVFCRSLLEMPDGSLIATMYGPFAGDTLSRSIVVRSTDGGTTWKYLSTIGYDPAVGHEGLDEPCLVQLPNGDLFCFMRNWAWVPMYSARSSDGGQTWTKPKRMHQRSSMAAVFPDLVVMSNGMLAASAGRRGCSLMFNPNPCQEDKWTYPLRMYGPPTPSDGPTSGYTGIREVAPNKLLYVYGARDRGYQDIEPGRFWRIWGVFVTVKPK